MLIIFSRPWRPRESWSEIFHHSRRWVFSSALIVDKGIIIRRIPLLRCLHPVAGLLALVFMNFSKLPHGGGAEALGMASEIGSLEPGKLADIQMVYMQNPYLTPTQDPFTSIVLYGSSADIDTVIVGGKVLKQDGRLTTINLPNALKIAQNKVEEILGQFFREHPGQQAIWEEKVVYRKLDGKSNPALPNA